MLVTIRSSVQGRPPRAVDRDHRASEKRKPKRAGGLADGWAGMRARKLAGPQTSFDFQISLGAPPETLKPQSPSEGSSKPVHISFAYTTSRK